MNKNFQLNSNVVQLFFKSIDIGNLQSVFKCYMLIGKIFLSVNIFFTFFKILISVSYLHKKLIPSVLRTYSSLIHSFISLSLFLSLSLSFSFFISLLNLYLSIFHICCFLTFRIYMQIILWALASKYFILIPY